jgi:hypothetical protein
MPPSNTSSCYEEAGSLNYVPVGKQDDRSRTCTARLRPRTSVSQQNETREESQLPLPKSVDEASSNHTRLGLNEARKRKKSECSDLVDQANPCKSARHWHMPISAKASRLYDQGGPGWVEAYEIEFRTVIQGSVGMWDRERARGGIVRDRSYKAED